MIIQRDGMPNGKFKYWYIFKDQIEAITFYMRLKDKHKYKLVCYGAYNNTVTLKSQFM